MKAIIIEYKNSPLFVSNVVEIKTALELAKMQKKCKDNLNNLVSSYETRIKSLETTLEDTIKRLEKAEKELAYNRGDLSEEEYEGSK